MQRRKKMSHSKAERVSSFFFLNTDDRTDYGALTRSNYAITIRTALSLSLSTTRGPVDLKRGGDCGLGWAQTDGTSGGDRWSATEVICSLWNREPRSHLLRMADYGLWQNTSKVCVCVCVLASARLCVSVYVCGSKTALGILLKLHVSLSKSLNAHISVSLSLTHTHTHTHTYTHAHLLPIIGLRTEGLKQILIQPAPVRLKTSKTKLNYQNPRKKSP